MQLDAFLNSASQHVPGLMQGVRVIYRSTDEPYRTAYDELRRSWPQLSWRAEDDFRSDVLASVDHSGHTIFHTDDDIYFAPVKRFYFNEDIATFSFRLGLNTTYCYPLDVREQMLAPELRGAWVIWDWKGQPIGALSYPLALNGHLFRTDALVGWLDNSEFGNPNELEEALQPFRDEVPAKMAAFRHSKVVSIPANIVTETHANRHAGTHTVEDLNQRFLNGERIDLSRMDFSIIRACHQEIPFAFRKRCA